jgi:uncharacterized protein (TIGR03437 family)
LSLLAVCAARPVLGQAGITLTGAGYVNPTPIQVAPGQVVTFFLSGLKTVLPGPNRSVKATTLPLPTTLAGISATIRHEMFPPIPPVPLFSVDQINTCTDAAATSPECLLTAVTVQIPFEIIPTGPTILVYTPTEIIFAENGVASRSFLLRPVEDKIHVLTTCDSTRSDGSTGFPCYPLVTHADGSLVGFRLSGAEKPSALAKPGETLVMWAFGLGPPATPVTSGAATPASAPATARRFALNFEYRPNAAPSRFPALLCPPTPEFTGLTPGFVGLYQINFVVPWRPPETPSCSGDLTSNLTVTIQGSWFDGAGICVDTTAPNPEPRAPAGCGP